MIEVDLEQQEPLGVGSDQGRQHWHERDNSQRLCERHSLLQGTDHPRVDNGRGHFTSYRILRLERSLHAVVIVGEGMRDDCKRTRIDRGNLDYRAEIKWVSSKPKRLRVE